jgi:hypothetical protein
VAVVVDPDTERLVGHDEPFIPKMTVCGMYVIVICRSRSH